MKNMLKNYKVKSVIYKMLSIKIMKHKLWIEIEKKNICFYMFYIYLIYVLLKILKFLTSSIVEQDTNWSRDENTKDTMKTLNE